jgi:predicted alpha/beta superfamily hydrolase
VSWRSVRLEEHEFFVRGVREPILRVRIGERWVDVWIPRGTPSGLLVAHDGQNIFDDRSATHRQTWDVARAAERAAARLGVTPPAVVGVWNGSTVQRPYQRGYELVPQKLISTVTKVDPQVANWFDHSHLCGDEYQSELAEVIIPRVAEMIDTNLPVAMMGSSMGALATLYALGERPELYGCGLAFSVHWPFAGDSLVDALINHLPAPGKVRVWMQNGTGGLDSSYAPFQLRADALLISRGYRRGRDFVSRVLRRSGHNEWSWARRLPDAIEWWLRGL